MFLSSLARQVLFNVILGAGLGMALAWSVCFLPHGVSAMIAHSANPVQTMLSLGGSLIAFCTVGAALSGFVFIIHDNKSVQLHGE